MEHNGKAWNIGRPERIETEEVENERNITERLGTYREGSCPSHPVVSFCPILTSLSSFSLPSLSLFLSVVLSLSFSLSLSHSCLSFYLFSLSLPLSQPLSFSLTPISLSHTPVTLSLPFLSLPLISLFISFFLPSLSLFLSFSLFLSISHLCLILYLFLAVSLFFFLPQSERPISLIADSFVAQFQF